MRSAAIIVAAGRSARINSEIPKQYQKLGGRPVLRWSVDALAVMDSIIVCIDPRDAPLALAALHGTPAQTTPGGATRTASVAAGLRALAPAAPEVVLIHDAARPGLSVATIARLLDALRDADGAAPALPAVDALKRADAAGFVAEDVSRDGLLRVQTPQAFRFAAIQEAYARLPADAAFEDDLAVARAAGFRVKLVAGDPQLAKITYPEDIAAAARTLAPGLPVVGSGFDAHRFGPGDHVTLCGVRIPHGAGLIGHSDADAAWHALTDAILGALGLGDIGDHFPPSDMRWKDAPSELFLAHALKLAVEAGAQLANADITLICEAPRIKPHREAMRARTAAILALPEARVSVKATTTEGLGFLGRGEGLAAQATALLILPAS
ncbi:MAG: bifunctional 2-C-methyl-D-erythritol 4-phosphate cytidylyltransferase/2-C-methyl-D-erythritol 2,4-cyclodiphosphate synthase [Hyphomonadaceae bacterium]